MPLQADSQDKNKARLEFGARFSNGAMELNLSVLLLGAVLLMPFGSRVVFAQNAVPKAAYVPPYPEATRELVQRIRGQLAAQSPPLEKWAVFYSPDYKLIKAESSETVWVSPPMQPNGSPFEDLDNEAALRHPSFSLRLERLVSPADYKRFVAGNAAIDTQLGQMQTRMKGISRKFDSFWGRTDHEKRQVAAYDRLKKSRHILPDFYFESISLSWGYVPGSHVIFRIPGESPFAVYDKAPAWEKEQAQVAGILTALVSHYEAPQK